MTAALTPQFPGAVVSAAQVDDLVDGTNRRAVVRLRYRAGQGPERVFVKREGRLINRLALVALGALHTEAQLIDSGIRLPLECPNAFAAGVDRRRLATVVVMEDVTLRSAIPNDPILPLTPGQVRNGLCGLAGLHAAFWDRPVPKELGFLRPWRLGRAWAPLSLASLARGMHMLGSLGHRELLPIGIGAVGLERGFRHWAIQVLQGPQTVLHGDPHPGNTYGLPGEKTGFYDWQLARTGSWAHDVGYFVTSSLEVGERRVHEGSLLGGYLQDLRREGVQPPDFESARSLYEQTAAFGLGTWLHTLAGGTFQSVQRCLAAIERFGAAYADHKLAC